MIDLEQELFTRFAIRRHRLDYYDRIFTLYDSEPVGGDEFLLTIPEPIHCSLKDDQVFVIHQSLIDDADRFGFSFQLNIYGSFSFPKDHYIEDFRPELGNWFYGVGRRREVLSLHMNASEFLIQWIKNALFNDVSWKEVQAFKDSVFIKSSTIGTSGTTAAFQAIFENTQGIKDGKQLAMNYVTYAVETLDLHALAKKRGIRYTTDAELLPQIVFTR